VRSGGGLRQPCQRRLYRDLDISITEATAGAAAVQLQMRRNALKQKAALLRR
jgi:hypothetical protein